MKFTRCIPTRRRRVSLGLARISGFTSRYTERGHPAVSTKMRGDCSLVCVRGMEWSNSAMNRGSPRVAGALPPGCAPPVRPGRPQITIVNVQLSNCLMSMTTDIYYLRLTRAYNGSHRLRRISEVSLPDNPASYHSHIPVRWPHRVVLTVPNVSLFRSTFTSRGTDAAGDIHIHIITGVCDISGPVWPRQFRCLILSRSLVHATWQILQVFWSETAMSRKRCCVTR
jgi:hypothetical protein